MIVVVREISPRFEPNDSISVLRVTWPAGETGFPCFSDLYITDADGDTHVSEDGDIFGFSSEGKCVFARKLEALVPGPAGITATFTLPYVDQPSRCHEVTVRLGASRKISQICDGEFSKTVTFSGIDEDDC